jgi:predicted acylesterase/phospholipase RssA
MTKPRLWTITAAVALLTVPFFVLSLAPVPAAQPDDFGAAPGNYRGTVHARTVKKQKLPPAPPPPPPGAETKLPPRVPFTAAEDATAVIPGMPDARFWADAQTDFKNALPQEPGPWLILSSGGSDGAFGAGIIVGLTAGGKRPDYPVVTGVSTGALMAPFAFAGPHYDDALRNAYTTITAADIYEAGSSTGESFVNSWPLRDFIAKEMTPTLLADIAAEYRKGRRLFVVTSDLDAERSVVWNMGAIAAHGGDDALKLFRSVLLASASIPGGFPPVLIDVEANGKRFQEMHVDGGLGGQFFVAPQGLMSPVSDYKLPATQLYIVVNTNLERSFKVVDRFAPDILTQSIGMAVPVDTRLMIDRTYVVAKRSGIDFNVATIPSSFNMPSKGAFDPKYMKALFQIGFEQGRSAVPFSTEPPPYPGESGSHSSQVEKTGVNR